ANILVIAADEAGSAMDSAGRGEDGAIYGNREVAQGVGFVQGRDVEEGRGFVLKTVLGSGGNVERFLAHAGNIQQQKDEPRANAYEVKEVAAFSRGAVQSGQTGGLQGGNAGRHWL